MNNYDTSEYKLYGTFTSNDGRLIYYPFYLDANIDDLCKSGA